MEAGSERCQRLLHRDNGSIPNAPGRILMIVRASKTPRWRPFAFSLWAMWLRIPLFRRPLTWSGRGTTPAVASGTGWLSQHREQPRPPAGAAASSSCTGGWALLRRRARDGVMLRGRPGDGHSGPLLPAE
jgi:hypothetical protein